MSSSSHRGWLWFFVLLAVAAPFAIGLPWWYNARQQLTLERLDEARRRWRECGPRDYVVEYAVRQEYNPDPGGRAPERFTVVVRGGQADKVIGIADPPFRTMDDLYDHIERELRAAQEAGGRPPFVVAIFGRDDGHVAVYRRSVLATRELYEVRAEVRSP